MSFLTVVMLVTLLPFPIVVGAMALEEIRAERRYSSRPSRSAIGHPALKE
jgi:hypothetical protein